MPFFSPNDIWIKNRLRALAASLDTIGRTGYTIRISCVLDQGGDPYWDATVELPSRRFTAWLNHEPPASLDQAIDRISTLVENLQEA